LNIEDFLLNLQSLITKTFLDLNSLHLELKKVEDHSIEQFEALLYLIRKLQDL